MSFADPGKPRVDDEIACSVLGCCSLASDRAIPGSKMLLNKPKRSDLGSLEKLPAEIRLNILELALDIHQTVTTRKCCGTLSLKQGFCQFHAELQSVTYSAEHYRTRFALLIVSHEFRIHVLKVFHTQIKVCADVVTLMQVNMRRAAMPALKDYNSMWRSISQFRDLELVVPAPEKVSFCCEYTSHLLNTLCNLFVHWEKQDKPGTPEPARKVTIHLGILFNAAVNPPRQDDVPVLENAPYIDNLEKAVELIVVKDWNVNFTFTAMTEIPEDKQQGPEYLNEFTKLLGNVGINFEGKTLAEASVNGIESRGAMGGTHRRFID